MAVVAAMLQGRRSFGIERDSANTDHRPLLLADPCSRPVLAPGPSLIKPDHRLTETISNPIVIEIVIGRINLDADVSIRSVAQREPNEDDSVFGQIRFGGSER